MLVLILIILLAAVGGFLGTLLEVALWLILIMMLAGAALGFFVYRAFKNLVGRGS